jgi:CBS domain-containing protein
MHVKELYRAVVVTVDAGESLANAARRMVSGRIGSLAVLDDGRLAGILTERDLVRAIADNTDMVTTPVGYFTSATPAIAALDEDAQEVADRMLDLGVRHLPVVADGEVVGMLSVRDLLVLAAWQPTRPQPSSS